MNNHPKEGGGKRPAHYLGAGLAIGAGVGAALDSIGAGIAIGLALGAALSEREKRKSDKPDKNDQP